MVHLKSAGAETRTLARPKAAAQFLLVDLQTDGGDVTVTVTGGYNGAGTTAIVFDDVGDAVLFYSVRVAETGASTDWEWRVAAQVGTDVVAEPATFTTLTVTTLTPTTIDGAGTNLGLFAPDAQQEDAPDPGAISVATYLTTLTTGGAEAFSLADGSQTGQLKKIMLTVTGGDATLTITTPEDENTVVFSVVGDAVLLMWNGTAWRILQAYNEATGSITTPALSTV